MRNMGKNVSPLLDGHVFRMLCTSFRILLGGGKGEGVGHIPTLNLSGVPFFDAHCEGVICVIYPMLLFDKIYNV